MNWQSLISTLNLPPREPGPLARYPRNLKMAVAAGILFMLTLPVYFGQPAIFNFAAPQQAHEEHEQRQVMNEEALPEQQNIARHITGPGDSNAAKLNDTDDKGARMIQAPVAAVTELTSNGELPKIAEDGRQPWLVYARPFNMADTRPKISIVMTELGLATLATQSAMQRMHANVTMAINVQSPVLSAWLGQARQQGHELLLDLPMEPFDYPQSDPGPNTLLTNMATTDNLQRLLWALRQATGYVGITTTSGSRFTTDTPKLKPVLDSLKQRGLMMFDARLSPHSAVGDLAREVGIPAAVANSRIDQIPTPEAIDAALTALEQRATQTGEAIAIATPLPVTLTRLEQWIKTLPAKGIALAPLSAMVQSQVQQ
jgi:polysaccharide deacetylase 2 family uncharacterized protein YibQ